MQMVLWLRFFVSLSLFLVFFIFLLLLLLFLVFLLFFFLTFIIALRRAFVLKFSGIIDSGGFVGSLVPIRARSRFGFALAERSTGLCPVDEHVLGPHFLPLQLPHCRFGICFCGILDKSEALASFLSGLGDDEGSPQRTDLLEDLFKSLAIEFIGEIANKERVGFLLLVALFSSLGLIFGGLREWLRRHLPPKSCEKGNRKKWQK